MRAAQAADSARWGILKKHSLHAARAGLEAAVALAGALATPGWPGPRDARAAERKAQTGLLRCIFVNPFRPAPAIAPAWLAWNGGTVRKLAEAIYEDQAFDRLPVLADALEDAGCSDADLLGHLRGPGPHARGCWAVDLLLGKA
jgi:hypothetical protein